MYKLLGLLCFLFAVFAILSPGVLAKMWWDDHKPKGVK